MLNELEVKILLDLFDGKDIKEKDYDLKEKESHLRTYEFASYIINLNRLGYIGFDGDPFNTGGRTNQKYRNNVRVVWSDKIYLKEKGIVFVKEVKKTVADKLKSGAKNIAQKVYDEIKDISSKTIAEIFTNLIKKP